MTSSPLDGRREKVIASRRRKGRRERDAIGRGVGGAGDQPPCCGRKRQGGRGSGGQNDGDDDRLMMRIMRMVMKNGEGCTSIFTTITRKTNKRSPL